MAVVFRIDPMERRRSPILLDLVWKDAGGVDVF